MLATLQAEPSRIRTYIKNLEGFRPNPLDDGSKVQIGDTGLEPATLCL